MQVLSYIKCQVPEDITPARWCTEKSREAFPLQKHPYSSDSGSLRKLDSADTAFQLKHGQQALRVPSHRGTQMEGDL